MEAKKKIYLVTIMFSDGTQNTLKMKLKELRNLIQCDLFAKDPQIKEIKYKLYTKVN